jgi:predicted nucleic acid-binding protein
MFVLDTNHVSELAEIRRRTEPRNQIAAYQRLTRQVEVFASWLVPPWDDDAADHFDSLKSLRQQVGTQDLKRIITATARAHQLTLVTCDRKLIASPHVKTLFTR